MKDIDLNDDMLAMYKHIIAMERKINERSEEE